jgi:hypothetical protein
MTHPSPKRTFTLRVRCGGDSDELDAVVAGAATWLCQRVDPSGRHPLEVTVADTEHGEPLARVHHNPTGAAASAPRAEAGPPKSASSTAAPNPMPPAAGASSA